MKKILFSVASKLEMRNHLLVPGGTFELLNNDKDNKIVLIISNPMYDRYKDYFDSLKSESVEIELIDSQYHMVGKNWLQKLFIFFYSYLVFTPTTRLIASKGARTGIVAAGGRSYLYGLKWLNYQLFGHFRFIKKYFVPRIYFYVFKDRPYKFLFDKHNPDLIFLPNVAHGPDIHLLAEAKRWGIKTIGMCGSWDHFNKYFVPLRLDRLLAWNDPLKEEALDFEAYESEQIEVVGFPQYDMKYKDVIWDRKEFLIKIGCPENKKIILFASEGAYFPDGPDVIDMIDKWIVNKKLSKDAFIILRLYPCVGPDKILYQRFLNHPNVFIDLVDNWGSRENLINFTNTIYHSDVIISTYSTIAIDGVVFDKPLINTNFDGYQKRPKNKSVKRLESFSHFKHVSDTGALSNVESENQLLENLNKYLENPSFNHENREVMQKRMCWKLDGKSSQRIVDAITKYLNE